MEALRRIQSELKAPKGQWNDFGKYKYRSCEDILEAVKPLLQGAVLTISDEIVMVGERYYVHATASLKEGTHVEAVDAYAREEDTKKGMDASQITGSASSYARKYALNGLFLIDDTQDADSRDNRGTPEKAKKAAPPKVEPPPGENQPEVDMPSSKQRAMLFAKMKEKSLNAEQSKEFYHFVEPATKNEASIFIDKFDDLFEEWKAVRGKEV